MENKVKNLLYKMRPENFYVEYGENKTPYRIEISHNGDKTQLSIYKMDKNLDDSYFGPVRSSSKTVGINNLIWPPKYDNLDSIKIDENDIDVAPNFSAIAMFDQSKPIVTVSSKFIDEHSLDMRVEVEDEAKEDDLDMFAIDSMLNYYAIDKVFDNIDSDKNINIRVNPMPTKIRVNNPNNPDMTEILKEYEKLKNDIKNRYREFGFDIVGDDCIKSVRARKDILDMGKSNHANEIVLYNHSLNNSGGISLL